MSESDDDLKQWLVTRRRLRLLSMLFLALYVASCTLTHKLGILGVPAATAGAFPLILGGIISVAALAWILFCFLRSPSPYKAFGPVPDAENVKPVRKLWPLRHPVLLGVLILLIGIPPIFGAWIPLLAVPGAFIAMKWYAQTEEEHLLRKYGVGYRLYLESSKCLIPRIY